ncbi:hypothetical protein L593_11655 [Salinarchaeum sp. Harcht-Bsk1]|nr:hypothetical protein L593_11655 [Salinarchaeum sp. Harcht-Bsk1]
MTGRRLSVTLALMLAVFVTILALALLDPVKVHDLFDEKTAGQQLFTALLSGAILLVSIVVSINSVTLSEEITDLENQEQRIQATLDYHRRIEEYIEAEVTPARPADFLTAVLYGLDQQAEVLEETVDAGGNERLKEDVAALTSGISTDVLQARRRLEAAEWGTFDVLLAGLNYDYSSHLHAVRGLRHEHGDALSDEERQALEGVVDVLTHIGTSREYFKSLYYKRELALLSSRLLYVGLPVIVFTSYVILALDAQLFPQVSMFGLSPVLLSVAFAFTVALAPYLVLTSYVLRATAVTLQTLAAGPFILHDGSNIEGLDWEVSGDGREWTAVGGHEQLSEELDDD